MLPGAKFAATAARDESHLSAEHAEAPVRSIPHRELAILAIRSWGHSDACRCRYNFRVLTTRDDENNTLLAQHKKKISKLKEQLSNLQAKYNK